MTVKPAIVSWDCSCGATATAHGSLSSTARRSTSGTPNPFCQEPGGVREYPEAAMSDAACTGLGVTGKLTVPPWPTTVVEVDVDVVGAPFAVVVGVVVVDEW